MRRCASNGVWSVRFAVNLPAGLGCGPDILRCNNLNIHKHDVLARDVLSDLLQQHHYTLSLEE